MILPQEYVVQKFCQYAGYPRYSKRTNVWAAGCPICREGTSWGKKRRLNYRVKKKFSVELAMAILKDLYEFIENDFRKFFPCLIEVTESYRKGYSTFLLPALSK